jgi:hypothetical protein
MISSEEVSIALGAVLKLQDTGLTRLEPYEKLMEGFFRANYLVL